MAAADRDREIIGVTFRSIFVRFEFGIDAEWEFNFGQLLMGMIR